MVAVALQAKFMTDDYVWRWDTRVLERGQAERPKAEFRQTTFQGAPLSPERLRKRAAGYVATLNDEGRIDRLILTLLCDRLPLGQIAQEVQVQFPHHFADWRAALTRVGDLSAKYSQ